MIRSFTFDGVSPPLKLRVADYGDVTGWAVYLQTEDEHEEYVKLGAGRTEYEAITNAKRFLRWCSAMLPDCRTIRHGGRP